MSRAPSSFPAIWSFKCNELRKTLLCIVLGLCALPGPKIGANLAVLALESWELIQHDSLQG